MDLRPTGTFVRNTLNEKCLLQEMDEDKDDEYSYDLSHAMISGPRMHLTCEESLTLSKVGLL